MQFQIWGLAATIFSLISGVLVSLWILEGFSNSFIENIRKILLGTICYGILTMLPFMFVFFLFNDNGTAEILEILGIIIIFISPLLLLYRLQYFPPLKDFLESSIIRNPSFWKDALLFILFGGTVYSLYFYGLILVLII